MKQFFGVDCPQSLAEAARSAYSALFESKKHGMLGSILTRMAERIVKQYDIPFKLAKDKAVQLQRLTLDRFAPLTGFDENHKAYKPETQPEFKQKFVKYYESICKMLCDNLDFITGKSGHVKNKLNQFAEAFWYMASHFDDDFTGDFIRKSTGEQYDADRIIDEFYPPAVEERNAINKASENAALAKDTRRSGLYTIVHIPDGDISATYSNYVTWCICDDPDSFWNTYSDHGENKCYFLLRDRYQEFNIDGDIDEATLQQIRSEDMAIKPYIDDDHDDPYGRSMIGLFVDHSGHIEHLFNRHNNQEFIYDEDDLCEILQGNFRELCPGYRPGEGTDYHGLSLRQFHETFLHNMQEKPGKPARQVLLDTMSKLDRSDDYDIRIYGKGRYVLMRMGPKLPDTDDEYGYDDHWGDMATDDDENLSAKYMLYDMQTLRPLMSDWATWIEYTVSPSGKHNLIRFYQDGDESNEFDPVDGKWIYPDWVHRHSFNYDHFYSNNYSIGTWNAPSDTTHSHSRLYNNTTGAPVTSWVDGVISYAGHGIYDIASRNKYMSGQGRTRFPENLLFVSSPIQQKDDEGHESNVYAVIRDRMSPIELVGVDPSDNKVYQCSPFSAPTGLWGDVEQYDVYVTKFEYDDHYLCLKIGYTAGPVYHTVVSLDNTTMPLVPWSESLNFMTSDAGPRIICTTADPKYSGVYDLGGNKIVDGAVYAWSPRNESGMVATETDLVNVSNGDKYMLPKNAIGKVVHISKIPQHYTFLLDISNPDDYRVIGTGDHWYMFVKLADGMAEPFITDKWANYYINKKEDPEVDYLEYQDGSRFRLLPNGALEPYAGRRQ